MIFPLVVNLSSISRQQRNIFLLCHSAVFTSCFIILSRHFSWRAQSQREPELCVPVSWSNRVSDSHCCNIYSTKAEDIQQALKHEFYVQMTNKTWLKSLYFYTFCDIQGEAIAMLCVWRFSLSRFTVFQERLKTKGNWTWLKMPTTVIQTWPYMTPITTMVVTAASSTIHHVDNDPTELKWQGLPNSQSELK